MNTLMGYTPFAVHLNWLAAISPDLPHVGCEILRSKPVLGRAMPPVKEPISRYRILLGIGGMHVNASKRRQLIASLLRASAEPITGGSLAAQLGVTRQVVVQDIAVLRASGAGILATPRGYTLMPEVKAPGITRLIAVQHEAEETREELYAAVDLGLEVVDVIVDHPVYGQLTGQLSLSSRPDVDQFLQVMETTGAGLLSSLTDGVHLHTIRGKTKSALDALVNLLDKKGFLLTE
jgi:transcriptional regulator of NAD metabolism